MKRIAFKTKTSIFRKTAKFAGVLMLIFSVFALSSCSRDDDPSDNDNFAGTYRGTLTYDDGTTSITKENGSGFVTKSGSATKDNFRFSDGSPDINGIEIQKQGHNTVVMLRPAPTSYIRIDNKDLKIFYSNHGKTWTANANR